MGDDNGCDKAISACVSISYVHKFELKKGEKIMGETGFRGEKSAGILSF
jgi:hypothetical protein